MSERFGQVLTHSITFGYEQEEWPKHRFTEFTSIPASLAEIRWMLTQEFTKRNQNVHQAHRNIFFFKIMYFFIIILL